jgi:hypothetical protein
MSLVSSATAVVGALSAALMNSYKAGADYLAGPEIPPPAASFEDGTTGGWLPGPNWSIANSTTWSQDGVRSLKCTRSNATAGNGYAYLNPIPCPGGVTRTASVELMAPTGGRYNITVNDNLGNSWFQGVTLVANTPARVAVTFTPGALAKSYEIVVNDDGVTSPVSGSVVYVDATQPEPGTVATPFRALNTKPLFAGYQTASQAIATGTWTALTFTAESVDYDNGHSTTTNPSRYTAQTAGWHWVEVAVCLPSGGNTGEVVSVGLRKNGSANGCDYFRCDYVRSPNLGTYRARGLALLAVGDYVEATVQHNHGSSVSTAVSSTVLGETSTLSVLWLRTT